MKLPISLVCVLLANPLFSAGAGIPNIAVERREVRGGGELITWFYGNPGDSSESRIPLLSVLKDTLGDADPANDRLRNVWIFPGPEPSLWRRALAGIPFFYRQVGAGDSGKAAPVSVLDLVSPAAGTWKRAAATAFQLSFLDSWGMAVRTPSRAYRVRNSEYRLMHIWGALDMISRSAQRGGLGALSESERRLIEGRLLLARGLLGGYVDDPHALKARQRDQARESEARGHNWDLLRQAAEENGLYFEPLEFGGGKPDFALLWFEQESQNPNPAFDPKFLGISDPYRDARLKDPKIYTETWWFDPSGTRVLENSPGAHPAKMIPLALYSLTHPRVPLLLIDFRSPGAAARREVVRRMGDDATLGILGLTGFANWPFLAAKSAWMFVHGRHGAALDREARIRAYAQLRNALLTGQLPAGGLRSELARNAGRLDINCLDPGLQNEAGFARKQYAALLEMADSGALTLSLDRERAREVSRSRHGAMARLGFGLLSAASLGAYRHTENPQSGLPAAVDPLRRLEYYRNYLEGVLAAGRRPEIFTNPRQLKDSVSELSKLARVCSPCREPATELIRRVAAQTEDGSLLANCIGCLQLIAAPVSVQPGASGF